MGINWPSIPIARITLAFALGIAGGHFIELSLPRQTPAVLLLVLLIGLYLKRNPMLRYTFAIVCWTAAGMWALQWQTSLRDAHYFSPESTELEMQVTGILREVDPGDDHTRGLLEVEYTIEGDSMHSSGGKWMLWLQGKSGDGDPPAVNDRIWVKAQAERPRPAMNPGAFDYRYYLWTRDIHRTAYVPRDQWKILGKGATGGLLARSREIKFEFLDLLHRHLPGEESAAFAGALLLGHKDDLSKELRTEFQKAGASHIMAVSGLHVGIIYSMIFLLLAGLHRLVRLPEWSKTAILISGVWCFAFICGLPASVCRAALMFSIWRLSKHSYASNQSFNAYFAAAFLLLLHDPKYLFQVGFQFSFLAVAGILLLYPKLHAWWTPGNKILAYAWQIVLVSASAQVFLLPLTAYYFGYCTLLSLLSSLVVIPAAYLILGLGVLLLSLAELWTEIGDLLGLCLDHTIQWTIYCVERIQSIPFGQWETEDISLTGVLHMLLFTGTLSGLALTKSPFYIRSVIAITAIFSGVRIWAHVQVRNGCIQVLHSDRLEIVWKGPGHERDIGRVIIQSEHAGEKNSKPGNHLLQLDKDKPLRWLILRSDGSGLPEAGLWLIYGAMPPEGPLQHIPDRIVLTKPLSFRLRTAWKAFAQDHGIELHDIRERGAFIKSNPLEL